MRNYISNPVFTVDNAQEKAALMRYLDAFEYQYETSEPSNDPQEFITVYQNFDPSELSTILDFVQYSVVTSDARLREILNKR